MPEKPTPEPIKKYDWSFIALIGLMAFSTVLPSALTIYDRWTKNDPPGPAPIVVPVVEPVKIDSADAIATLNGIRLNAERTKLLVDLVNAGEGTFVLRYQPVGKAEITRTVTVQGGVKPVPPLPPRPDDPPVPPKPDDNPPPIPAAGFRVLVVYENNPSDPAATLTKEQRGALSSQAVRSYLDSKCAKGKDGKTPEWRMVDQHVDLANETEVWKEAMKLPRNVLPWIVISDGKTGTSEPLPANEADLLALLKKFGG